MKKEKTVRTYQRRTKFGKMVTVHEHKASYDAAEEARKAAAKKSGAGSELSKKKAVKEESPLGFSADDYKAWYHWDMEDDANNEAALRVEKALTKSMGKKAYNKYLEDMSNSYSARGHKKAHQSLLDEHTARQKKQDAEISKAAKDIARGAKEKAAAAKASKAKASSKTDDSISHIDESTFWTKEVKSKKVGDQFSYSEGKGKDKMTYDAHFVTDGKGGYKVVINDGEKPKGRSGWATAVFDGYEKHAQLPTGLRKAAEAQGLTFKGGEFVKSSGKSTSTTPAMKAEHTITDQQAKRVIGSAKPQLGMTDYKKLVGERGVDGAREYNGKYLVSLGGKTYKVSKQVYADATSGKTSSAKPKK